MKGFDKFIGFFVIFLCIGCDSIFLKSKQLESDFKKFTENADSILHDGDLLQPVYAYIKNGKIKGIEFNGNPECGNVTRRFYLDENENADKVVIEIDFFSDHCGKTFDSIYVIYPKTNKIEIYTKSTNGKSINDSKLIDNLLLELTQYKKEVKNGNIDYKVLPNERGIKLH